MSTTKEQTQQPTGQIKPVETKPATMTRQYQPLLPSLFTLSPREFINAGPFELMRQFTQEMERAFGAFSSFGYQGAATTPELFRWQPAVEVFEHDNKIMVRAELPGMTKDDVQVELVEDTLIIKGERKTEKEEKEKDYYCAERSYGSFYRAISLPAGVSLDAVKADLINGVLEVTVPIPEGLRKRRSVPIGQGAKAAQQAVK